MPTKFPLTTAASIALSGLIACGDSGNGGLFTRAADPSTLQLKAVNTLPPGQSGFVSLTGQVQGLLTMDPGQYGPHLDDQRLLYWSVQHKPGALRAKCASPESPRAGVEICVDEFGVPAVYGDNLFNLWYGVGYAVARDRLFLLDAARRMARGTLAELTGCGTVPADIQQRVLTYTDDEYRGFFARIEPDSQQSALGYIAGANAWIAQARSNPLLLPAEYGLLTSLPEPISETDALAIGVLITRTVASDGGNEFQNIRMLKLLQQEYGTAQGFDAFQDLVWLEDPNAAVTVPRAAGSFSNQPTPSGGFETNFRNIAQWALTLPRTLESGPGTGATPAPCDPGALVDGLLGTLGLPGLQLPLPGLGAGRAGNNDPSHRRRPVSSFLTRIDSGLRRNDEKKGARAAQVAALQQRMRGMLDEFRRQLHGGSWAVAIGPGKTRDRGTLLISEPQLGYTYPTLLVEYEIHSGDYHARGVSVPGLPVVGIGYNENVAWGLTTGYSKTIDSFIETICSTTQQTAGTCTRNQYFHNSQWKNMDCRTESVRFRAAQQGIPLGPALLTQNVEICRTVHGPVVARDDAAGLARSVQYAMWLRETDNIDPIREWNRADSFADMQREVARLTWNENLIVASRDGHIGYFHPGLYPRRHPNTDQRFPTPGSGEFDRGEPISPAQMPQVVDPPQGFVANWNNKPAYGWLDGEGISPTSRPGGVGQRVASLQERLAAKSDWSFEDLKTLDREAGGADHRAREYLPIMLAFGQRQSGSLTPVQKAALALLRDWNGSAYGPELDINNPNATDGPAATLFSAWVEALRDELFANLKDLSLTPATGYTVFSRSAGVGSHVFDQSALDNLIVRVLRPGYSGLTPRLDYTDGRSADQVLRASLDTALERLRAQFGVATLTPDALTQFRRVHPRSEICSLSGVIGPGSSTIPGTSCVTMPYQDRGSWVHLVGFEKTE